MIVRGGAGCWTLISFPVHYIYHNAALFDDSFCPFPSPSSPLNPPLFMSLRHLPRQSDRDRPHETTPVAVHAHPHNSSHPQHLNGGNPIPSTPSNTSNPIVSPAGANTVIPNGVPAPSIIHKLNVANEQTWLLIGMVTTLGNAVLLTPTGLARSGR
jgi:hypothetical protein